MIAAALGLPSRLKRRKPQSAAKKVEKAVERAVGNVVEVMATAAIKKITGWTKAQSLESWLVRWERGVLARS